MHLSILKTIKAERIKLKGSPVWLAFFTLPAISAFFGTFNYINNQGILKSEWYSLWTQHSLFLCYLFMPALIGTYCSYLWRLEHMRGNWNSFLTAPVPYLSLYLGKLFQAAVMTVAGGVWIFCLYFLCGKFCGLDGFPSADVLSWFGFGTLGGLSVCCVQLALSLFIRSFAVPIGIALAGGVGGLAFTSRGLGLYFPYSLYSIGMRANNPLRELDTALFLISCAAYTILFSIISVRGLARREC